MGQADSAATTKSSGRKEKVVHFRILEVGRLSPRLIYSIGFAEHTDLRKLGQPRQAVRPNLEWHNNEMIESSSSVRRPSSSVHTIHMKYSFLFVEVVAFDLMGTELGSIV